MNVIRGDKGLISVFVLWMLFFLSMLAVAVNIYIGSRLTFAGTLSDHLKVYYLARAGAQAAVRVVGADTTEGFDALNESWSRNEGAFKDIDLGGGMYSVHYPVFESGEEAEDVQYGLTDEERKININKADAPVLKNFFEIVSELSGPEAAAIADAIVDWRDEDQEPLEGGAEDGYYQGLASGYPCKDGPFEILEELLLVRGMTQDIFEKTHQRLTVYGTGAVNINTADVQVLQSLGMGKALAGKVLDFRDGADSQAGTADDILFESSGAILQTLSGAITLSAEETAELTGVIDAGRLSVRSDNFSGYASGTLNLKNTSRNIAFVVNRNGVIKSWHE